MNFNPTERFSDRVEQYVKHRPSYPAEVVEFFRSELGLTPASFIADIGSGTGKLAELFLRNGNQVIGIEPNQAMREAGEHLLKDYPNFRSYDATAEATTLESGSVDFIIAGQAFHWFDVDKARVEFARISKPQGCVALIWNNRRTDSTPFLRAYEQLLQTYGTDYKEVAHQHANEEVLQNFFAPAGFKLKVFENQQIFDHESLLGRLLSSSYTPLAGHPKFKPMVEELRRIFDEFQTNGKVSFDYDTQIFYGRVGKTIRN